MTELVPHLPDITINFRCFVTFVWFVLDSGRDHFWMWTLVRHEKSNLCLSCQGIIITDAWSLMICWDLFWMIHINKIIPFAWLQVHRALFRLDCSQVKGDIMLFVSLQCKGMLVHMYFLDAKCVLIFKTDNNKMLYLKIVWCLWCFFRVYSHWLYIWTNQIFFYFALPANFPRCTDSNVA